MNTNERQAGRELDALIAERVMGWMWMGYGGSKWFAPREELGEKLVYGGGVAREAMDTDVAEEPWWLCEEMAPPGCSVIPPYSVSIAAAWQVVEKLRTLGLEVALYSGDQWDVKTYRPDETGCQITTAPTAALAICRAALAAIESGVQA